MNSKKIIIEKYNYKYFDDVCSLLQEISFYIPDKNKCDDNLKSFTNNENSYSIVAKYNEQLIGFGSIFIYRRVRGGIAAVLEDIVVDKEFRSKKVGSLIVNKLIDHAIKNKCFKISLATSKKNISFYEKLKFKRNGISMDIIINN